ncbi:MAG: flagellar FlbD family protein [Planctomycetota bacterium]
MITLTRLNDRVVVVNAELIKIIEATPDTTVTLIHGETLFVREPVDEVVRLVIDYRRQVHGFRVV